MECEKQWDTGETDGQVFVAKGGRAFCYILEEQMVKEFEEERENFPEEFQFKKEKSKNLSLNCYKMI